MAADRAVQWRLLGRMAVVYEAFLCGGSGVSRSDGSSVCRLWGGCQVQLSYLRSDGIIVLAFLGQMAVGESAIRLVGRRQGPFFEISGEWRTFAYILY